MAKPEKKPEPKKAEPPAEQPRPMAVPAEPDPMDRLRALEARVAVLEKGLTEHKKYHFGGVAQD